MKKRKRENEKCKGFFTSFDIKATRVDRAAKMSHTFRRKEEGKKMSRTMFKKKDEIFRRELAGHKHCRGLSVETV